LISERSLAFQKLLVPIILLAAGALLAPLVFPRAIEAITNRFSKAGYADGQNYGRGGVFGRAIYGIGAFRFLIASTPPQGYQLGVGGNAASAISNTRTRGNSGSLYDPRLLMFGREEVVAVETDWGRQIVELGPVLGILFIVFRLAFVIWLGKGAVAATMRSNDPLPLLLFAFIGVHLFNGQITGHGTLNGYAWMFSGFCMSINRNAANRGVVGQTRPARQPNRTASVAGVGFEPQIAH